MLKISARSDIRPFVVMDVMEAAARHEAECGPVLHLEVGQPSTPAPSLVRRGAAEALERDRLGYTVAVGIPELRERISAHYLSVHGVSTPAENVVITPGSSGGFLLAFLAAFQPGDRVALPAPGYPCYKNILQAVGLEVVSVACGPETRYQVTPEHLDALATPVDGLVIASPSNPTGTILDASAMSALVAYCKTRGIRLISDEIYHGIEFLGQAVTAAKFGSDVIVVNSFSKYFSMTGWRIGWMVVPPEFVRPVEKLIQNLFIATSTISQVAAVRAFDCHLELKEHVRRYARNRDIILTTLDRAGLNQIAPPDGAFYIYADVSHLTTDSPEFCRKLLAETSVAITPGVDFDPVRGGSAIRFSYATSTDAVEEAMRRCLPYLK